MKQFVPCPGFQIGFTHLCSWAFHTPRFIPIGISRGRIGSRRSSSSSSSSISSSISSRRRRRRRRRIMRRSIIIVIIIVVSYIVFHGGFMPIVSEWFHTTCFMGHRSIQ